VSAGAIDEGDVVHLRFGAGRCASRQTMEGTSDRECVRLSRGPRGTDLGGLRDESDRSLVDHAGLLGGGDRGARGGRSFGPRGKRTPARSERLVIEVGAAS